MADSFDTLINTLEAKMISQICSIGSLKAGTLSDGKEEKNLSFENVLENAIEDFSSGGTAAVGESSSDGLFYGLGGGFESGVRGSLNSSGGRTASEGLIRFIADHEGYSATSYRGIDSQNETIGYGHVIRKGEDLSCLSRQSAMALLKSDLSEYERSVSKEFSGVNLTQNQFDALVSFSYSLGAYIWDKVPGLTSDIKSGASPEKLRQDFISCDHCNGVEIEGLKRRRMDEWKLFVSDAPQG